MKRDVQLSLTPDFSPDRPVGPIPASVQGGLNADLMVKVAPLYLTGSVMDCTYGEGGWWRRFRPEGLIAHDLHKLDGVDFRALPEGDNSIDTVVFDPPYIPQGGYPTNSLTAGFADLYGLVPMPKAELWDIIDAGLGECARVARRWVLVKCCDFVTGAAFTLGHRKVMDMADERGLAVHDLIIHHTGSGPGGHNIFDILRARRHHSYLVVFDASKTDGSKSTLEVPA